MRGRDIKPGMFVDARLVLEVDLVGDHKFWDGKPNYTFIDIHDPYFGPCSGELLVDDEYDVTFEQDSPEYKKALLEMIGSMNEYIEHRTDDIKKLLTLLQ